MATKQCPFCDERVEGLCAQDAWGLMKTHVSEAHGKEWNAEEREWV